MNSSPQMNDLQLTPKSQIYNNVLENLLEIIEKRIKKSKENLIPILENWDGNNISELNQKFHSSTFSPK